MCQDVIKNNPALFKEPGLTKSFESVRSQSVTGVTDSVNLTCSLTGFLQQTPGANWFAEVYFFCRHLNPS